MLIFLHNYYPYVLNVLISQRIFGLYIEACQPSAGWMSESKIKVVTRLVPDFLREQMGGSPGAVGLVLPTVSWT